MSLKRDYNVKEVWGVKWGYRGFYEDFPNNWVELTPENVDTIHNLGGTVLGSSRGGFNGKEIIKAI
jgi:6-phosphofructokinase 1